MQLGVLLGSQLMGGGLGMRLLFMGASIIGSMLLNGKKKPVGKLNDLRVSSATYGRGIAIVYGTMRVTGNCFWATDFEEEKFYMTQKGKRLTGSKGKKKAEKGKAQEMYEYFANFSMGLCEGPVDGILRVWADNNLIYDKLNPNNEHLVDIGFSQAQSESGKAGQKSGRNKKGSGGGGRFQFTFYPGNESQMPEPFIVEKQGAATVPAYRGLSYLFFRKFPLQDFGNRTPTITAEVTTRLQTRPFLRSYTNLEPNNIFQIKVQGACCIDIQRNRLYHGARLNAENGGYDIIRVFDMAQEREIKRIPLGGPEWEAKFPQSASAYGYTQPDADNPIMETLYSVAGVTSDRLEKWVGLSAGGDLVFAGKGNTFTPTYFVDPDTLMIKGRFGGSANLSTGKPYALMEYAKASYPLLGNDMMGGSQPVSAVVGLFGDTWVFNGQNHLETFVDFPANRGKWSPATNNNAYVVANSLYTTRPRVYRVNMNGRYQELDEADEQTWMDISKPSVSLMYSWPPEGEADTLYFADITFFAYSAQVRALCMIAWVQDNSFIQSGVYAVKIDAESGEELWRFRIGDANSFEPMKHGFMTPNFLYGSAYVFMRDSRCWEVDFRLETVQSFFIGADYPEETFGQYYFSQEDAILYFAGGLDEGKWIFSYLNRKVQTTTTISQICRDVCQRVGIPDDRIVTTGLDPDEAVTGYMVEQPVDARSVLEELGNFFQFDCVESDHVLKFKTRGSEPVITIPQDDLGVVETDFGGENEYYAETRFQESELPERVNVTFVNPEADYEQGTMHYKRPLRPLNVMGSRELLEVTINMAMTPSRAKTFAQRILFAAWGERTSHEYVLPQDYLKLDPSDVITVEFEDGRTLNDRITDIEVGADMSMKVTTISQIASVYRTIVTGDGGDGRVPLDPTTNPPAHVGVFDIPYIEDDDVDESGEFKYYWSALPMDVGFRTGALMSKDATNETDVEGTTTQEGFWGYVGGTIPAPPDGVEVFDLTTEIKLVPMVDFSADYTWASIDDEDWPNLVNMLVVGDEVILFKTVVENADGSVTISHLVRGYRGTGVNAYKHIPAERWVLMTGDAAIRHAMDEVASRNKEKQFYVSTGSLFGNANAIRKTLTAASRKPWQVGALARLNTAGTPGSISIDWRRATRFNGPLRNGYGSGSVPLNEEEERYAIFLLKQPYDPATWNPSNEDLYWHSVDDLPPEPYAIGLFRTRYTFDASVLTAAGLTYQSDIHVVIYQKSTHVGLGYEQWATLPYSRFGI